MNPTPPPLPSAQSPAGFPFAAPGDLPPLNARFAAHLDKTLTLPTRRRIVLTGLGTAAACLFALLSLYIGLVNQSRTADLFLVGVVATFYAGRELVQALAAQKNQELMRCVVQNGVPVTAYLVQANQLLFSPGRFASLPCLVLFSFQPEVAGDADYMAALAQKVFRYKNTKQAGTDEQTIAHLTTDERAVFYRRRKLPFSFTDGSTVYCADLWIKRAYVPGGFLQSRQIMCLAEPGEPGGLEQVPSFLLQ